jgi:hypothetical protein
MDRVDFAFMPWFAQSTQICGGTDFSFFHSRYPTCGLVPSTMGMSHGLALLPTDEAEVIAFPGMRQLPTGMDVTSCLRLLGAVG